MNGIPYSCFEHKVRNNKYNKFNGKNSIQNNLFLTRSTCVVTNPVQIPVQSKRFIHLIFRVRFWNVKNREQLVFDHQTVQRIPDDHDVVVGMLIDMVGLVVQADIES